LRPEPWRVGRDFSVAQAGTLRQDEIPATKIFAEDNMIRSIGITMALCTLLAACEGGDRQGSNSGHIYTEHKQALDKAKEVDRLAREAAERQRKVME
jgi:hypothetical protein